MGSLALTSDAARRHSLSNEILRLMQRCAIVHAISSRDIQQSMRNGTIDHPMRSCGFQRIMKYRDIH